MNSGYLASTDYQTLLNFHKKDVDLSRLEDCNVVALSKMGFVVLFKINPPDRSVSCYSFSDNSNSVIDVVDVFNFIQNGCVCWVEL